LEPTIGGKWLELLKEIAPGIARVAILFSPDNTGSALLAVSAAQAAPKFAVDLMNGEVRQPAEIDRVITTLGRETGGGLIVPTGIFTNFHRSLIIELASRYRVPAIYAYRFFVAEGGLASYGVVINMKTAKALGLTVPLTLQVAADEVIE
jgi:putative ABC transport system substrate-binding protein